ncbi:MAG: sulfatase-like hydrolase/transferase [Bacteroidales bacterium]
MKNLLYLTDFLSEAEILAPAENYVEIQRMNLSRQSRSALFQHPNAEVEFKNIFIGDNASLAFETGIAESVWDKFSGTVIFTISIAFQEKEDKIFETSLSPGSFPEHRKWHNHQVDLGKYARKSVNLKFITKAVHSSAYAWAAWAEPCITHEIPETKKVLRKTEYKNLFVITADAMSRRFFGCYGSPEVKTPNIDEFANESIVFDEAWSNSTTTPGSYATLWSGLHPKNHRLISEWGPFPQGVAGLPLIFNGRGYHTVMFTGEAELSHSRFGFSSLFNESHGAIANPAQDGAITIRKFGRWLQQRPDKPILCWLQFFDTHPPNLPPVEFAGLYYSENPEEVINEPDKVQRVFGIESLVEFERSMTWLAEGRLSGQLRHRLWETIRALKGMQSTGPDLYEHLKHMNPKTRLGMKDYQFGLWMEEKLVYIEQNKSTPPEFLKWINYVRQELAFIQEGIISWLKNVKDFRYPVSQYKSCMTYFDHLFGQFINILKHEGLYDKSTIVLVSPHGEILSYDDAIFHHHMPHPNVLSIPMIIKMAGQDVSARIKGIMNLSDLSPTITEMFFGDNPFITNGVSRWKNIIAGTEIPEKFSIAFDIGNTLKSVAYPPYFYFRADDEFIITPTKYGHAGEEFLFKITDDEYGLMPLSGHDDIKALLRERLREFEQG